MKPFSSRNPNAKWLAGAGVCAVVGWAPLFIADVLRKAGYDTIGFGLAWGLSISMICSLGILICVVVIVVRSAIGK